MVKILPCFLKSPVSPNILAYLSRGTVTRFLKFFIYKKNINDYPFRPTKTPFICNFVHLYVIGDVWHHFKGVQNIKKIVFNFFLIFNDLVKIRCKQNDYFKRY